jgi:hypothetical protein
VGPRRPESADRDENLAEHQQVADNGDPAVCADGSMTGGPREHQQPENRHQLVGPHQSGDAKNQVQLHNQVEDQIFHKNDFEGGTAILLQPGQRHEAKVTKVTGLT